jgi:hypothetical protein
MLQVERLFNRYNDAYTQLSAAASNSCVGHLLEDTGGPVVSFEMPTSIPRIRMLDTRVTAATRATYCSQPEQEATVLLCI